MGNEMMIAENDVAKGSLEQIFRALFFDFVNQKVDGLLVLDNQLNYIAGNERGKSVCHTLFPFSDASNASCSWTAQLIKRNYQLGNFQFDVEAPEPSEVFDFSIFPKMIGHEKSMNCYLCTIGKKGAKVPPAPVSDHFDGLLTKRQAEVVELMASGLSNKEIADALFISERTVHKHLENVRVKLGVNNRMGIMHKLNLLNI